MRLWPGVNTTGGGPELCSSECDLSLVSYTEGKTMGALSCRAINSCDRISMASRAQCLEPSSEGYLGGGDKPRKAWTGALGGKNQNPSPGPSLVEHSSWPETG